MRQHTKRIPAKGTSRRVVIVPGNENSVFEQIIYVVRDDPVSQRGVTADHVLREAEQMLQTEQTPEEYDDAEPLLFSRLVLILMVIIFILTAAILVYLHFHGLS